MRIALATDAWRPQTNGVVTTLARTLEGLERHGHVVRAVHPSEFHTVPCPTCTVAAYPVAGPLDVVHHDVSGALCEDLATAVRRALELDRDACRRHALAFTWERATAQFLANLALRTATS
jgi:hypothetical protein